MQGEAHDGEINLSTKLNYNNTFLTLILLNL